MFWCGSVDKEHEGNRWFIQQAYEEGMRFESATVPAAVMPGHAEVVIMVLRNTCHCGAWSPWEGFPKPGLVRRPARDYFMFNAFGIKSKESLTDSCHKQPGMPEMNDDLEKRLLVYPGPFGPALHPGTNVI
jgi:hypothetical protein